MKLTFLIAQIYAVVFIVVSLGLIFNPDYYRKALNQMMKETGTVYLGGAAALVVGFLILSHHWIWRGWPVLVSLLGVIALLKGLGLLLFPDWMVRLTKSITKRSAFVSLWGGFTFILGLLFAYIGWFAA